MRLRYFGFTFLGMSLFCSATQAGQLAPNLAALANGKASATAKAVVSHVATPAAGTPSNTFDPRVDSEQRVQVYVYPETPYAALISDATLTTLGAVDIHRSELLRVVQAWAPISALKQLAALPGVGNVTVPVYARSPRPPVPQKPTAAALGPITRATTRGLASGLPLDQEGIVGMQADKLQQVNAQGAGVKVGVISDGVTHMPDSQATGYLPASVWTDPKLPGSGDEGTAMLEEVHAVAHNAALGFCGPNTSVDFLTCYQDLIAWGANVVTDDLGFPGIDMFSAGTTADNGMAAAVAQITQKNPNVAFTSAGGNDAQDYFQAKYTPAPKSATVINGVIYASEMDFGAATGHASTTKLGVVIPAKTGFQPMLQWNDPTNATPDAFTLFLTDSNGNILKQGQYAPTDTGRQSQFISYTAGVADENDFLVIACQTCANPVSIKLNGYANGAEQFATVTDGSVGYGHVIAPGVMTTVAAHINSVNPLSITTDSYSATGPYLFGDYTNPQSLAKPNLTGISEVTVSGAGGFGVQQQSGGAMFAGTSATSPNVAALIADLMQAYPGQPASTYYQLLQQTANQPAFTSYTQAAGGSGLAQGYTALASFFHFSTPSITAPVAVASGATGSTSTPATVPVTFTAAVKGGTNPADASQCIWLTSQQGAKPVQGASVPFTFPSPGSYSVYSVCPDKQGIVDPTTLMTVNVAVTAAPPAPTPAPASGGGGGGAAGPFDLLILGALALLRRGFRRNNDQTVKG